jgi:hypothetical protein
MMWKATEISYLRSNAATETFLEMAARLGRTIDSVGNKCRALKLQTLGKSERKPTPYSKHPLREILKGMKRRCYNPRTAGYKNYGGRGITVCHKWRTNTVAFIKWALANGWKPALEIERIDVNGNYEPGNCRFATNVEQANNTRKTIWIEAFGIKKCLSEWMVDPRTAKVSRTAIVERLQRGLTPEQALTTPNQRAKKPPKPKKIRPPKIEKPVNPKRPLQTLTAFGITQTYAQWQDDPRCRVCRSHIWSRVKNGWNPEEAITLPAGAQRIT